MTRYLIKKTYTPTESNDRYSKDYKEVWYCGKDSSDKELCDYIKERGYARKHFAQRYIDNDKEFNKRYTQHWNIEYEIIEVEA